MSKVLVHADGGDCHGTPLTNENVCPKCGIHPDSQSTEFWEIESSPIKQNYIDAFKLLETLETNVRSKIASIEDFDTLSILDITDTGVEVETVWQHCGGCGNDYTNFTLTWEELSMSDAEYKAHYQEKKKRLQKEAEELRKKEIEAENKKRAEAKERRELSEFKRLQKKFGKS